MTQTIKKTAEIFIKKFGKEEALKKAEGGVKASQQVLNELKFEDPIFTFHAKYWNEVAEKIKNHE